MAYNIVATCKGCPNKCPVIFYPARDLEIEMMHPDKASREAAADVYVGNYIIAICMREKRFFKIKFTEV